MNKITTILDDANTLLGKSYPVGVLLVVFSMFIVVGISFDTNVKISATNKNVTSAEERAKVEYAYNVLKLSLEDLNSEEEIVSEFKRWNDEKWTAQLGALKTICENSPNKLVGLVGEETSTLMCRKV